jgi:hypothetical protein
MLFGVGLLLLLRGVDLVGAGAVLDGLAVNMSTLKASMQSSATTRPHPDVVESQFAIAEESDKIEQSDVAATEIAVNYPGLVQ